MSDTRLVIFPLSWCVKEVIRTTEEYNNLEPATSVDWEECLLAIVHALEYTDIPYDIFINTSFREQKVLLDDISSHASTGIYEMIIEPGFNDVPDDSDDDPFGTSHYENLDNAYNEVLDLIITSDYFAGLYLFIEDIISHRDEREDILRIFASRRSIGVRYGL